MQAVHIVPAKTPEGKVGGGFGTKIFTGDGEELNCVLAATVRIEPGSFIEAEMTVVAHMEEVWALPFMSEESFLAAAERYGYEVKKKETA